MLKTGTLSGLTEEVVTKEVVFNDVDFDLKRLILTPIKQKCLEPF
jgi:hypothetical protein